MGRSPREIGVDLGDRLLLLGRERERKRAPVAVEELARLAECRRARLLGERLAPADEAELEQRGAPRGRGARGRPRRLPGSRDGARRRSRRPGAAGARERAARREARRASGARAAARPRPARECGRRAEPRSRDTRGRGRACARRRRRARDATTLKPFRSRVPWRRSSVPGASFARCAWLNQTTFSSTPAASTTTPSTTLRFRRRVGRTRMRASLQRTVASCPRARSPKLAASSQSR